MDRRELEAIPRLIDIAPREGAGAESDDERGLDEGEPYDLRDSRETSLERLAGREMVVRDLFLYDGPDRTYLDCVAVGELLPSGEKVYFFSHRWRLANLLRARDRLPLRVGIIHAKGCWYEVR